MIQITKVVQPTEGAIVVARCPLCKVTHIGSNWRLVKPVDGDYWLLAGCPLSAHRDVPLNCEVGKVEPDGLAAALKDSLQFADTIEFEQRRAGKVAVEGEKLFGFPVVASDDLPKFEVKFGPADAERVLSSQWRSS